MLLDQRRGARPQGVHHCLCGTSTSLLLYVCLSHRRAGSLLPEMGVGWWRCHLFQRLTQGSTLWDVKPAARPGVQCLCRSGLWKVRNCVRSPQTHEPHQPCGDKNTYSMWHPQVAPQHPGCYWSMWTMKICPLTSCANQKDALSPHLNFRGKTITAFEMSVNIWRIIILWSL